MRKKRDAPASPFECVFLPSMVFLSSSSFSLSLSLLLIILTCLVASAGTSLYVLNERAVVAREGAACLRATPTPTPLRCRSIVVFANDDDDDAKNDRTAEATKARDASAVASDAFSAAVRIDCCRNGRSCRHFGG